MTRSQPDMAKPRTDRRHRHPMSVRITRAGWLFLAVALMVTVAAGRGASPMLYIISGGMLAVMYYSAVRARSMVQAVTVSRKTPQRLWQGQTAPIAYFTRNLGRHRCMALKIKELSDEASRGDLQWADGFCAQLLPRTTFRSGARFVAERRGRITLGTIRLETEFPLGLIRARKELPDTSELIVWPARGRLRGRLLHRGASESYPATPSAVAGGQDEFFGLRDYHSDDNPRWIHWRRSATTLSTRKTLVVREMSQHQPEVMYVVLDTQAVSPDGLDRMLRFAATLIDHAFVRGYEVGLVLTDGPEIRILPAAAGMARRLEILDTLALAQLDSQHSLADVPSRLRGMRLRQAHMVLVCASDRIDASAVRALRSACRHVTVLSTDKLDRVFDDSPPASHVKGGA